MEQKSIIAVVVFSIALLVSIDVWIKPSYAQSASAFNFNLNGARNQCDEVDAMLNNNGFEQHFYGCIANEGNSASHTFSFIESASSNPITRTLQIFPLTGGCSPIINPCNADGGSVTGGGMTNLTGQSGKLSGIFCGITSCYTMWINNGVGYSHQLIRISFTPSGGDDAGVDLDVTGYLNFSSSFTYSEFLTGLDTQRVGIGSVDVWLLRCAVASCLNDSETTLVKVQGLQQMGVSRTDAISQFFKGSQSSTNGWGIASIDVCFFCDGNATNTVDNKYLIITSKQGATTNRAIDIWDFTTNNLQCGASNNSLVATTGEHTALGRFYNQTRWLYVTDANLYLINLDTCAKEATTAYATLGIANYVADVKTNTTQTEKHKDPTMHTYGGVFWIQHGNTSALSTLTQANATTFNTLVNFDNEGTGAHITNYIGTNPHNSLNGDVYRHTLLRTATDSKAQIIFFANFVDAEEPPPSGGGGNAVNGTCQNTDTNGDGINGTVLDCIGDRSLINSITGAPDVTIVSGNLFCGVGLNTTCSGDVKTNGTGIILMLIVGVFFAGATLSTIAIANSRFGAGISFTEIPKEFWLFLVVGVVGLAFYFGWIDDIIFYGLVVGLAGLFAFGLYKHIRGG